MTYDDLAKSLRVKADMVLAGEFIAWGSDAQLMREAAQAIRDLQAQNAKLRGQMEKLCRAAIPMFTDEDGLVHFDTHPKAIDLWSEVADARILMKDTP